MSALVTGATGFLGGALTRRLLQADCPVTATGRNAVKGRALAAAGATFVRADLTDREHAMQLCEGKQTVFHAGALSSPWGRSSDFYRSNVEGTRHVVAGCLEHSCKLIHVSTPAIYVSGEDRYQIRESDTLPKAINAYAHTKRLAEVEVAKGVELGLSAVTVRPRAIFGPGDTTLLPRLVRALKRGRLPIIGNGETVIDITYIDNVVDALLLCAQVPRERSGAIYNITNSEPVKLWEVIARIANTLGFPAPKRRISVSVAHTGAGVLEGIHKVLLPTREPLLTRYSVAVLSTSITLDISAAQRDLGYAPRVSVDKGLARFLTWWKVGGL